MSQTVEDITAVVREHLEGLVPRVHGSGSCLTATRGGDVLWFFFEAEHLDVHLDIRASGKRVKYCDPGLLDYVTQCVLLELGQ